MELLQIEKQPVQVAVRAILRRLQLLYFPKIFPSADGTSAPSVPPVPGATMEEGIFPLLCCDVLCSAVLYVPDVAFSGLNAALSAADGTLPFGRRHSPGGSRRGLVIALRIIHQTITCVYGGRFPALGTEQILPLYLSRSQDGVFAEKGGIENAVLHSQGKNALHVGSRLFIEAGGKVFVAKARRHTRNSLRRHKCRRGRPAEWQRSRHPHVS